MDHTVSLKLNHEFRRLYAKGKSAVNPCMAVYCRKNRLGYNRLGFTTGTKLGKAVVRNRTRRRLREAYRLHEERFLPGYDIVVVARVRAVLRRTEIPNDTSKKLTFDKLVINLDSYELIVNGQPVDTPPKELELLFHLASSPNRVFTRNQLLDEVWGFDYFGDSRTVDVHIKRLREKLEGVSDQWRLKTVWGVGYKFEVSPAGTPG